MSKKVLLFSTRFLENESIGRFFDCKRNVESSFCKSKDYYDFFLDEEKQIPDSVKNYLNHRYYSVFFHEKFGNLKDDNDNTILDSNDSFDNIAEKGEILSQKFADSEEWYSGFEAFIMDIVNIENKLPQKCEDSPNATFPFKLSKEVVGNEDLVNLIIEDQYYEDVKCCLNTDSENLGEKANLSLRFKLYKLKENIIQDKDIVVYAVWCLKKSCNTDNTKKWYKALCEEIKLDLNKRNENVYKEVNEIDLFLHDGDVDPHTTFEVRECNKTNTDVDYSFLSEGTKLNVALFQHSNDPIATILNKGDNHTESVRQCLQIMKDGGILGCLLNMSDNIASWHNGGNEKYRENAGLLKNLIGGSNKIEESNTENQSTEMTWSEGFPYSCKYEKGTDVEVEKLNTEINGKILQYQKLIK